MESEIDASQGTMKDIGFLDDDKDDESADAVMSFEEEEEEVADLRQDQLEEEEDEDEDYEGKYETLKMRTHLDKVQIMYSHQKTYLVM